ncbi:hypothetical protein [Phenylobacterium sp.]|uniref:hypothetical protein n=1 Tax=Phenylobacterium sp. TaxID=1871053 RepID=UPI002E362DB2|nr:hypothetical protein [Phenylobacterium sp.]HEX2558790.1 hypothetical protein [Phenylobacterium sp.]
MNFRFLPVLVAAGDDGEGRLAFCDDKLVAVLVRLSAVHGQAAGRWFLEAAFGRLAGPTHPTFASLDEAQAWIEAEVAAQSLL